LIRFIDPPEPGYRFLGFSDHKQDGALGADQYANPMTGN